jgi:PEP-CTERM motif
MRQSYLSPATIPAGIYDRTIGFIFGQIASAMAAPKKYQNCCFFLVVFGRLDTKLRMKMQRVRRSKLTSLSNSRWAAYATAGAATVIAGVNSAEAAIHYSGVLNVGFSGTQTMPRFALDQPNDSFILGHFPGVAGFIVGGIVSAAFRGTSASQFVYPSHLAAGINIATGAFQVNPLSTGGGQVFGTLASNQFNGGQWRAADTAFVGFRFNGGSGLQYGWARLTMNGTASGNTFTLVDYAWGDVGIALTTGQIPEPGSLGLLALGGVGLMAWRKRRSKAVAA